MKQGARRYTVGEHRCGRQDLQSPGQRGGEAEKFLVEIVPEPADGLRNEQSGSQRVSEDPEPEPGATAPDIDAERTAEKGPVDRVAAVPDREHVPQVRAGIEIVRDMGEHMIETRDDDPQRHRPQRDVDGGPRSNSARAEPTIGDQHRSGDPGDDAQRIHMHGERADLEARPRGIRTWDTQRYDGDHGASSNSTPTRNPRRQRCAMGGQHRADPASAYRDHGTCEP